MQRILYFAPPQIKRLFVAQSVGELLMKLYRSTLNGDKMSCDLHDELLSAAVNLAAHCPAAKHVLCYGQRRDSNLSKNKTTKETNPFLTEIVKEAFAPRTRYNAYLLCFDLLDAMMLDVDGIAVLITNQKGHSNLMEKCWTLISSKKLRVKHRRICCIKLLRNG